MKLNLRQIASVKQELGVDPIEEKNPAMEALRDTFGDHTFYVGTDGLFVIEPANDPTHSGEPAHLVLVGAWADEQRTALQPVPRQATEQVVDLAVATANAGDSTS